MASDSFNTCINNPDEQPPSSFLNQLSEVVKNSGMSEKCKKVADTFAANMAAEMKVAAGLAASGKAAGSILKNKMEQEGCGQWAVTLTDQLNSINRINCTLQRSQTDIQGSVSAGTSVVIETLPLTQQEQADKASAIKLQQELNNSFRLAQVDLIKKGIKLSTNERKLLEEFETGCKDDFQKVIDAYDRSISLKNTKIVQSIITELKGSIVLDDEQAQLIADNQEIIAKTEAESKLKQKLGVNSLTDNQRSIIAGQIRQTSRFTAQNVKDTLKRISVKIDNNGNIAMRSPQKIDLENVTIDQNIVSKLSLSSFVTDALKTSTEVTTKMISDIVSKTDTSSEVNGLEDIIKAQGDANKKLVEDNSTMMIIIIIFVIIMGLGGSIGGVFKLGGAVVQKTFNNFLLVLALASLIVGIVFLSKGGVGNYIIGSILVCLSIGLTIFSVVMRSRIGIY